MTARVRGLPWLVVAILVGAASPARGQPASASSGSLEVTARADELSSAGEHRRAEHLYRRALEIDDGNQRAWVGLSAALGAQRRDQEALRLLDQADARLGWTAGLATRRGIHLSRLRRWDAAIEVLQRVVAQQPGSFEAGYPLGTAHLARRQWGKAIAAFDRYLAHRPRALAARDWQVETRRALALLHRGQVARARRDLERLVAADPRRNGARLLLFTALASEGNCGRALALAESLRPLAARAPTVLYDLAVCRFRTGDGRGALAALKDYGDQPGRAAQAVPLAARVHASLGEHAQAVALLWPLVEGGSQDAEVLWLAGAELAELADLERAAVACQRLVEIARSTRAWMLLARVQVGRRRWAEAEHAFASVLQLEPKHAGATAGLVDALAQQATVEFRAGRRDAAQRLLVRAHELAPAADAVAHNLALVELDGGKPARAIELLAGRRPTHGSRLLLGRAYLLAADAVAAARELEAVAGAGDAPAGLRVAALAQLAHLASSAAPERALELVARARALGVGGAEAGALLDRAEAEAQLAVAQRDQARGAAAPLRTAMGRIAIDRLPAEARTRVKLLQLFVRGDERGLAAALKDLAAISDAELAAIAAPALTPAALRHALALHLGARFIGQPGDHARYLRAHADGLRPSTPATVALLTAWYDRMLGWALERRAGPLARALAQAAPPAVRSPTFQHNAVLAEVVAAGGRRFAAGEVARLQQLAPAVPEALVNLALDAEARGDQAAALGYLRRLPAARRTPELAEWLRWKALVHGAP